MKVENKSQCAQCIL